MNKNWVSQEFNLLTSDRHIGRLHGGQVHGLMVGGGCSRLIDVQPILHLAAGQGAPLDHWHHTLVVDRRVGIGWGHEGRGGPLVTCWHGHRTIGHWWRADGRWSWLFIHTYIPTFSIQHTIISTPLYLQTTADGFKRVNTLDLSTYNNISDMCTYFTPNDDLSSYFIFMYLST